MWTLSKMMCFSVTDVESSIVSPARTWLGPLSSTGSTWSSCPQCCCRANELSGAHGLVESEIDPDGLRSASNHATTAWIAPALRARPAHDA